MKRIAFIAVLAAAVIACKGTPGKAAAGENQAQEAEQTLEVKSEEPQSGAPFIDFAIKQPDGKVASLSDYVGKGKYILVDFWASWCPPCRAEIPNIKAAYEKYKGDKFDVLSVAVWDKVEDTRVAAEELGVVWNQIVDAQKVPTDLYGIEGIPHLILFAPDGSIVTRGNELRGTGLDAVLGKYIK